MERLTIEVNQEDIDDVLGTKIIPPDILVQHPNLPLVILHKVLKQITGEQIVDVKIIDMATLQAEPDRIHPNLIRLRVQVGDQERFFVVKFGWGRRRILTGSGQY